MENKIKAVVVDDDNYTLRAIKKYIENLNVTVDDFNDPIVALEAIKNKKHELIITDNFMSGIDGIELAERILEIYKPVIVLVSAICHPIENLNGDQIFDYMFTKPLDFDEFVETIIGIIKELENKKIISKIEIKDRILIEKAVNILKVDPNAEISEIYKVLSEEMKRDESTIRKRFNKIDGYLGKNIIKKIIEHIENGERENDKKNSIISK